MRNKQFVPGIAVFSPDFFSATIENSLVIPQSASLWIGTGSVIYLKSRMMDFAA